MEKFQRQQDETPEQYRIRLYKNQALYNLTNKEIGDLCNEAFGVEYDESAHRKYVRPYLDGYNAAMMDIADGKDYLKELELAKFELSKERQRVFDQRREFRKLSTLDARTEHLYDTLEEAAHNLNDTVGKMFDEEKSFDVNDNEAVLVFSDWHYGMVADNIFNCYDTKICKQRVHDVVENAIERIQLHKCKAVNIVMLGDSFHGAIHAGVRVASEELVSEQIMQVSEIIAQSILRIRSVVPQVNVYMTYGNHGRTVQSKVDSLHADNMERLVKWWLKQRLAKCDGILFPHGEEYEFLVFNVMGHGFCASHGDLDNVRYSTRLLPTLIRKTVGKDVEYVLLGDKHHVEMFDEVGVTAQLCGSLCGVDDYANDHRLYSDPSQLLLIVDKNGVDAEYRLKCC